MPQNDDSEVLLIEGMKSYPQALAAMDSFLQIIEDKCRNAVSEQLSNLQNAMGIQFAQNDIYRRRRPNIIQNPAFVGADFSVGIKVQRENWKFFQNISWEMLENDIYRSRMWISIITPKPFETILEKIKGASHKSKFILGGSNKEVWLGQDVPQDISKLSVDLDELTAEWIRLWKEIGGLRQFLDMPTID